jgi:hypothetical protein
MRPLILFGIAMRLAAQDTPAPVAPVDPQTKAAPPADAAQKPDAAKPADAAQKTEAAASPVPLAESWLTGSIDLGYRWRTGVAGSFDTYRSIVNLGSGPKLLGADFTITDPKRRAFDRIDVRASSWGDDPYSTLHLHATKAKLYDFNADYRDITYFNFLPSYADPLLARGIALDQQSFDVRRRFGGFQLEMLPGHWFIPYIAFDRDSGSGTGATTFVSDANEYAVPNQLRDQTNLYRGGVRLELRRFHATIEEGGTTFKDDQSLFQNSGPNFGSLTAPVLGQRLSLNNLLAAYGVRGNSVYTKVLLTASAASWLDLYGQFLYSRPDSTVNYQETAAGTLIQQSQLIFYNSEQFLLSAEARMPHTSGSAGAEIRLPHNVRILESWLTDRLDNAGTAASSQILSSPGLSQQIAAQIASSFVTNYNQVETTVIWDALSRLTVRGGYRRVWGDANEAILPPEGLAPTDSGKLRQNVVIGGFTLRPLSKLSVTGEAEGASDNSSYFRTSLHDYQKARGQVRYQAVAGLSFSADFNVLNNQNPATGVKYDYQARQESLSFLWQPAAGKLFDVQGSYSRSSLSSDIGFLTPQNLQPQQSIYRDNANTATALLNLNLPRAGGLAAKITAGGSFFISSGSRPTSYYQPIAKLWLPMGKKLSWFAEWRYFGYGESLFLFEGFRAHTVTAGVRIMR